MRTVELLLDEAADAAVREAWRRLADAGLPSQARHRSPTNSPHLTLASCPELTAPIRWELAEVAAALPLPVRFAGLIRFERPTSVLAWSLAPDAALAELHRKVWDAVTSDNRPETLNPFHAPGNWSPHITLGRTRRAGAFTSRRIPALLPAPPLSAHLATLRSFDTETGTLEILTPGA
ncbi:2'-5' RNA ligase [Streptomyces thermodiastaticus]|uniref:2'-5' RNA ligase n=1 Tax=Streptomyces thermodiastaticus TaxID=44061 RepID=A0ABU0K762_9ACTN|nr:2'-5' RNA ligase [Streptomyces thermodiastaticus]UVT12478.1 2'-5' RNA ligase family protein [Streptomyces thermocarboxydus]WSB44270.1 2'-5' RNA ligase family protein [Streptomyces cellulosae]WSB57135.1 2'-5' RNA ligase family protein [Streptomyces cellulosae]WTF23274.1 2'-5' RNA ligase family protein [Streptomyces cellulosae]